MVKQRKRGFQRATGPQKNFACVASRGGLARSRGSVDSTLESHEKTKGVGCNRTVAEAVPKRRRGQKRKPLFGKRSRRRHRPSSASALRLRSRHGLGILCLHRSGPAQPTSTNMYASIRVNLCAVRARQPPPASATAGGARSRTRELFCISSCKGNGAMRVSRARGTQCHMGSAANAPWSWRAINSA